METGANMKGMRFRSIYPFVFLAVLFGAPPVLFPVPANASGRQEGDASATQKQKQFFFKGKPYSFDYQFINNTDCLKCHANQIDAKAYAASAHGANSCNSCHWEIKRINLHVKKMEARDAEAAPVDCSRCHAKQALAYAASIHHKQGFTCTDCHSDIHTLPLIKVDQKHIYQICTNCHDGSAYAASVHGRAALAGNPDVPGCTDCHGVDRSLHHIEAPKGMASKKFHTAACAACHADVKKMKRNGVDPLATKTYYQGIHGKIEALGYPSLVAGCSDCHGAHNVLPAKDPKSTIAPRNLVKTCGKCHPGANASFVQYIPHLNYRDPRRPVVFWAYMFMHGLLFTTFGFFWLHTFLFWRKDFWMNWHRKSQGLFHPETSIPPGQAGQTFRRFSPFDRILHFMLISSFMILVLTGLPLAFPTAPWAARLMEFFGGYPTRGIIHRIFACILIAGFTALIAYILYFLFMKKIPGRPGFRERLFGPDSLFPRIRDVRDLLAMLKWFVDRGPRPEFDRWSYWEKFDFFAVFWGMVIIGTSGLIRWFPVFFTRFLPGWIVNVAVILHSDEALLALGFIFTVHFFNNHLRPRNFPLNTVIFTGRLPLYQLMEDHALQVKRLVKSQKFLTYERKYPGVWADLFSRLLGFLMLGIGAVCLILIGWKFLSGI
jgi:cytochrome b subunit of formate dehydrogenase